MNKRSKDSLLAPLSHDDAEGIQLQALPIVDGVPKLLFTDDEVASMFGFSVSTVHNRSNSGSRWHDPRFPRARSTDGSGENRKAAVRWNWFDLFHYANDLPTVSESRQLNRSGSDFKPPS